jgi:hypothetical protein
MIERGQLVSRLADFTGLWEEIERDGGCDGLGGMEYCRILAEWIHDECPVPTREFIWLRANVPEGQA